MNEHNLHDRIRLRAYQIWEDEGNGQHEIHWFRAEAEIR
jgi:hypothetical protein